MPTAQLELPTCVRRRSRTSRCTLLRDRCRMWHTVRHPQLHHSSPATTVAHNHRNLQLQHLSPATTVIRDYTVGHPRLLLPLTTVTRNCTVYCRQASSIVAVTVERPSTTYLPRPQRHVAMTTTAFGLTTFAATMTKFALTTSTSTTFGNEHERHVV